MIAGGIVILLALTCFNILLCLATYGACLTINRRAANQNKAKAAYTFSYGVDSNTMAVNDNIITAGAGS